MANEHLDHSMETALGREPPFDAFWTPYPMYSTNTKAALAALEEFRCRKGKGWAYTIKADCEDDSLAKAICLAIVAAAQAAKEGFQ